MAHTIYFSSLEAQRAYFAGKVVRTFTDYTLVRNAVAYVEADLAECETWNYCMIENKSNGDSLMRRFYFIESVEYIDELTTGLHLKLDVMQTFQHQPNGGYAGNLPQCFVEREHSVYDGAYAFNGESYNTLLEELDTGDLVIRDERAVMSTSYYLIVAATIPLQDANWSTQPTLARSYTTFVNGIWSGMGFFATELTGNLESSESRPAQSAAVAVGMLFNYLNDKGLIEAIHDIYIIPKGCVEIRSGDSMTLESPFARISQTSISQTDLNYYLTIPSSIGNYTPRNKKLLQYPYCFAYVTDQKGLSAVYKFEYFTPAYTDHFAMDVYATATSDAGILLRPSGNYKGSTNNKEAGIAITNFPHIPWNSDTYKLWLAQTANTRKVNLEQIEFAHTYQQEQNYKQGAEAAINMLAGGISLAVSGGLVGGQQVASGMSSAADTVLGEWANDETYRLAKAQMRAQVKDHAVTPPQSRGGAVGMLEWVAQTVVPVMQIKTVDDMHARIIDQYFDRYGYATNSFKVPNIHSRPAWNFVKTAGFDAKLSIAQRYKVAISDCFNSGITFWKNGDQIGNYNLSNAAATHS
jgi:hypothetical protein